MSDRPYVSFAEVKQKVAVPEVLETFGIAGQFEEKGETLTGVCPLPGHKHGPMPNAQQFKINRKDGIWLWHCFGDCQRGGDVVELVKLLGNLNDAHARLWFAQHFGDRLSLKKPKRNGASRPNLEDLKTNGGREDANAGQAQASPQAPSKPKSTISSAPSVLKPLRFFLALDGATSYLRQRGLNPETINRYGLGLCKKGLLDGYVAIPIYAFPHPAGANPVAYLGRWPGDDYDEAAGRPRYRWPKDFPKSEVVYGLRKAMEDTAGQPLIVVEGPFKVFALVQAGFLSAVATFGSSLSDAQAELLVGTGRPIILLFDGDDAGQAGMRTAAGKLITRTFVRVVKLDAGQEPDAIPVEDLRSLLGPVVGAKKRRIRQNSLVPSEKRHIGWRLPRPNA